MQKPEANTFPNVILMGNFGNFTPLFEPPQIWTKLKNELLTVFVARFTIVGHPNSQTATLYDIGKWVIIYVSEWVSESVILGALYYTRGHPCTLPVPTPLLASLTWPTCVGISFKGQTRFARLHCSAFGLELFHMIAKLNVLKKQAPPSSVFCSFIQQLSHQQ